MIEALEQPVTAVNSFTKKQNLTRLIKREALHLGFDYCGIARADFQDNEKGKLENWLNNGFHGSMHYMARNPERRVDPQQLLPGAKSVISVLLNYYSSRKQSDPAAPKISKYAFGTDYHIVMIERLEHLLSVMREHVPGLEGKICVDSAPVMEKTWAQRSGLGWIGKNTNLINKEKGSFFFIGEIITNAELEYDRPLQDYCGTCTRCIDACPTQAIIAPYILDARKCISYLTIELKEEKMPPEFQDKMNGWVFGCDICQDVCPWNHFASEHNVPEFDPKTELMNMNRQEWEDLTEGKFNELCSDSPMQRAKYKGIRRNIATILQKEPG
ncbi:MAG: tRNA epoxyqueuosine(34) reductase QueG [Bacteroidetes bacterium]|nr:tRNA epoxyqueuosine(34) reductase QueG [Bacteroidota bacterium]